MQTAAVYIWLPGLWFAKFIGETKGPPWLNPPSGSLTQFDFFVVKFGEGENSQHTQDYS